MAKTAYVEYIVLEEKKIPVNVFLEWRKNARISIGKKGINLRLPKILGRAQLDKYLKWCKEWTLGQIQKDPSIRSRLFRRIYKDGDQLIVGPKTYDIQISHEERKTHTAKLEKGIIVLKLNRADDRENINSAVRKLLSRVIASDQLTRVEERVDDLNDRYFKEDIGAIRIKYNQSNWGSCSAKKNINLSSRLLFAPDSVIDYVIIHELAHLKELNHSKKFWRIVSDVMPDYKVHEKWLKENGHLCDF